MFLRMISVTGAGRLPAVSTIIYFLVIVLHKILWPLLWEIYACFLHEVDLDDVQCGTSQFTRALCHKLLPYGVHFRSLDFVL